MAQNEWDVVNDNNENQWDVVSDEWSVVKDEPHSSTPVSIHAVNQGLPKYNKDIEHNNFIQDLSENTVEDMKRYGIINGLLRGPIEAGWNATDGGVLGMVCAA